MRPEKKAIIDEMQQRLEQAVFVIITNYRGLKVEQANDLRRRLGKVNADFRVVKNRLFKRVARGLKYEGLEPGLDGPSAMVFGQGDVVAAAKVLKTFVKEHELPVIKVGAYEGKILSQSEIQTLADLPSRPVLYAQLAGVLAAPMAQLVGVLQQKLASVIYVLKAVQEKKEKAAA